MDRVGIDGRRTELARVEPVSLGHSAPVEEGTTGELRLRVRAWEDCGGG